MREQAEAGVEAGRLRKRVGKAHNCVEKYWNESYALHNIWMRMHTIQSKVIHAAVKDICSQTGTSEALGVGLLAKSMGGKKKGAGSVGEGGGSRCRASASITSPSTIAEALSRRAPSLEALPVAWAGRSEDGMPAEHSMGVGAGAGCTTQRMRGGSGHLSHIAETRRRT